MSPEPGLWRLTLDTNPDDCNLRCIMCEEHSSHRGTARQGAPRRMPFSVVERVLTEALPLGLREVIPSTMGEPLLWEGMDGLIDLVTRLGLQLNVTTNGTFPGRGAARWAETLAPVTSDVKISWNGATAPTYESIMTGSRFGAAVERVREFASTRDAVHASTGRRCRLTFQLTFIEANFREIPAIVELAAELGVDRVKGHHVWMHWPFLEHQSLRRNADTARAWNDVLKQTIVTAQRCGVLLENFAPLGAAAAADLDPEAVCPFLGREAWISAEGRFAPCCAPDDLRRGLGDFGTLHQRSLTEIWRSPEYRSLVTDYRTRGLCRACNMRRRDA